MNNIRDTFGTVKPPKEIEPIVRDGGTVGLNYYLTLALQMIFVVAILGVLFMVVWGAFEYITSGGDVDKTKKAREKITMALIGLAVLAFSFLIVNIVGQIFGFGLFNGEVFRPLSR